MATMTDDNWLVYTGAESQGISVSQEDLVSQDIDMVLEIKSADSRFVEQHFAGHYLAGEKVHYNFNRWGQLRTYLNDQEVKGGVRAGIHKGLANGKYFELHTEVQISGHWTVDDGILFPDDKRIPVRILYRDLNIIGIYKAGTKLQRTVKWFEKNVYKTGHWKNMKVSSLREFRPETKNDVYKHQTPEFTRVSELEEIRSFLDGFSNRQLSWEEAEIMEDIRSILGGADTTTVDAMQEEIDSLRAELEY